MDQQLITRALTAARMLQRRLQRYMKPGLTEEIPKSPDSSPPSLVPPSPGLIKLVIEIVQEVTWPQKPEYFSIRPDERFRSEVLLTLLTYCYATGNYGSREVESVAAHDPHLRHLFEANCPDWKTVRRFRRVHRDPLRQCILSVLEVALQVRFGEGTTEAVADHCVAVALEQWFEPLCVAFPDEEATERIERAAFVDDHISD